MFASNIWTSRRVERIDVERRREARSRGSPTMFGLHEDRALPQRSTSQRSSLDQMRNKSFRFCASQNSFPEREPPRCGERYRVAKLRQPTGSRARRAWWREEIARGYAPFTRIKIKRDVVSLGCLRFPVHRHLVPPDSPSCKTRFGRVCVCFARALLKIEHATTH